MCKHRQYAQHSRQRHAFPYHLPHPSSSPEIASSSEANVILAQIKTAYSYFMMNVASAFA